MKKYENGRYIELSDSEIELIKKEENKYLQNFTYDEAINQKIRERYTESQEFAILRQKEDKPDEYKAYYEYCEECKKAIKTGYQEASDVYGC